MLSIDEINNFDSINLTVWVKSTRSDRAEFLPLQNAAAPYNGLVSLYPGKTTVYCLQFPKTANPDLAGLRSSIKASIKAINQLLSPASPSLSSVLQDDSAGSSSPSDTPEPGFQDTPNNVGNNLASRAAALPSSNSSKVPSIPIATTAISGS